MAVPTEISGPKGYPIIGNILELQDEVPLHAVERLADIHGPIFKIKTPGSEAILVSNFELFDELCDETRFYKLLGGKLAEASAKRSSEATGLFTQSTEKEEDWGQAHRILMPAFGPLAVADMFDEMHDIASQLVLKWARQGPQQRIAATEDFTRLTLDTIALCSMDFRFNSFYQEDMHPFVKAMNTTLGAASSAGQLSGIITKLMPSYRDTLEKSADLMRQTSMQLVQYRRDHPTEKKDLLNALIYGQDPKTGKTMRDSLIAANMQTFLVAGHETTSGLLSFAFLQLLKNPKAYFAAQAEVDSVIGHAKITPKHINELKYINAILRETLRLTPTAPAFGRAVRPENSEETVYIGGKQPNSTNKYAIPRGRSITCLLGKIHTDPKVWGDDAQEFKPERMLDEAFDKLPKNAWKPFGTGMRACIGRAFAWQEAVLVMALILQNFDLRLEDPSYEMKVKQTLTMKPKGFYIRASLRDGITSTVLLRRLSDGNRTAGVHHGGLSGATNNDGVEPHARTASHLTILYGSNTGTCQALAQKLSAQCQQRGFEADVHTLDAAIEKMSRYIPTVIITASYEGQPTDDAARFVAWLESLKGDAANSRLEGVRYAVFGCGHSDWRSTFQRIPTLLDDVLLPTLGAERLVQRGVSDVSKQNTFDDFEAWTSGQLWSAFDTCLLTPGKSSSKGPTMPTIELDLASQERAAHLQQSVQWANVLENRTLTAPGEPEKRHIEFELPSIMSYTAGDYLAVLPLNPKEHVRRVMNHFNIPWDAVVTIQPGSATSLPKGTPMGIFDLLQGYVEISQPASKRDLEILVSICTEQSVKQQLTEYLKPETFTAEVVAKRITVLDILRQHKEALLLAFGTYLSLLPPMRTRHYSISSTPLASPHSASLTYSVLDAPAWYQPESQPLINLQLTSNHTAGTSSPPPPSPPLTATTIATAPVQKFLGVATSYLCSLTPGDQALVSVRSTNKSFHLPTDQEKTPIVMLANGSGIAPFRGFVQERATLIRKGSKKSLAPALLIAGCRRPGRDQLYAEEFAEWAHQLGAVEIRWVFSQARDEEKQWTTTIRNKDDNDNNNNNNNNDDDDDDDDDTQCKYVQDMFVKDFDKDIMPLWEQGAKFYICGSKGLAQGVGAAARKIAKRTAKERGESITEEDADKFITGLRNERFVTDIF